MHHTNHAFSKATNSQSPQPPTVNAFKPDHGLDFWPTMFLKSVHHSPLSNNRSRVLEELVSAPHGDHLPDRRVGEESRERRVVRYRHVE
jgi:hypothetical protein